MKEFRLLRLTWLALILSAGLAGCDTALMPGRDAADAPRAAKGIVDVDLIAFNDFHGNLDVPPGGTTAPDTHAPGKTLSVSTGGAAYMGSLIARLKAANSRSVVVGAGDMIGASPITANLLNNEPSILTLNAMGLDLTSVGNHEFDRGKAELLRMQNGGCLPTATIGTDTCVDGAFPGAKFHYLAANVIDTGTGKPLFPGYEIREFSGGSASHKVRVAFIGVVLKQTADIVRADGVADLKFISEVDAANALIPEIKAKGANAIVLLIHQGGHTSGLYDDPACPDLSGDIVPLMDALDPAIRVVISGHTHEAYVCTVKGRLLTSAGAYGRLVTDVKLGIDTATDSIVSASAHNLPVVNDLRPSPDPIAYPPLPKDPVIAAMVDRYDALTAPMASRVVGKIKADFSRMPNEDGESSLGDLVADAQLAAAPEAQIAFTNSGGIRENLLVAPGEGRTDGVVNFGDVFMAQPFRNTFVVMDLSGMQIMALLEQQHYDTKPLRLLQVSQGFSYAWSRSSAQGHRIEQKSIRIDGKPLVLSRNYRVVVNDYLASGGDSYNSFVSGQNRKPLAIDDASALENYIHQHSPLMPKDRHRITRVP